MSELYYLYHKNMKLASFLIDNEDILEVKYNNDADMRHLPIGYTKSIKKWLHSRGVPVTRFSLQYRGTMQTSFRYMLANYGLSLTDCYWLKPADSDFTWESVNLYANTFKDTTALELQPADSKFKSPVNVTPSGTLHGDLRKKWLISDNGQRVLAKGNWGNSCLQAISEVFATEIYNSQPYKIAHTPYSFIKLSASGRDILGCVCPAYTSEELEFVSAYDLLHEYPKPNNISTFQWYKQLVYQLIGRSVDAYYDMMLMVDFVITNTDRHFSNLGVLRNPNTLQYVCPAPIYDNGNSLFHQLNYTLMVNKLSDLEVLSSIAAEVELLKEVEQRGLLDIRYLPSDGVLFDLLLRDVNMPEECREHILKEYKQKIKYLQNFQNGMNLWEQKYCR